MANRSFNLTAELNVRGPSNLRIIAADIRRQLGSIDVDINPRINANANRNITNLNNGLRTLNATLAATQTSATNAANAIRNFSQAISSVGTRNINQTLTNAATAAQTLGNNASTAGTSIGQAATQMEEFGRQSALAVRRFAAFSIVTSTIYGLINAINGGVKAFISFDKEFVRLQQVTGESAQGLRSLAAEITRLSTSLGVSSEDLTTVSVTLAQAGLSATETRKALQALAKSALAPSFDNLNDTVEGSIALMRQFGISADQLEGALGSVNAVAAKFAVEASDLIAAIQRTGGVFATASRGVSEGTDALNEFLAVFTSIRATTRESAETIATGLRTIFTRIQRQDTIDALQNLGIELRNAQGQFVGAFEAVRRLSQGLSKIDPRSREFAAISEELGGFRQIGKVIPLIQQFATAQQALKVAQTGQASLAEDSVVAQKSVANQIAKVREEFTALIRSIGESESFRSFVRLSLDLASALIRLADSAKTVLPALTAIAAFKGVSALTQFSRGFAGGVGGGRRFATGGYVPGSGNRDTVPAMLTPGEFVIRKKAVQSIGVSKLESMNKYASGGRVQKLNAGGYSDEEWSKEMESIRRKYKLPSSSEIDAMSPAEKQAYEDRLGQIAFSSPSPGREKKAILAMKQRSARKSALGLFFSAAGMKRGPKAPAGMFEQTMAKYQGLGGMTSVKPKFIAWGKGQGSFGDIVRGSEDKIRSQLSGVNLSHFDSLLKAGTLQNYLASGGKQGHIPPLKKAIYSILGVTGKNSGGYIQKFVKGGEAVDDPILSNLVSRIQAIGGPAAAKKIAAEAGISFSGIPSMAFKQSTLASGKVSKENVTKLVSLVSAVENFNKSSTISALAESKAPIEKQIQGLSLRGPNPKQEIASKRIGGKKIGITRKVAPQGLADKFEAIVTARSRSMIAELSNLLDGEMKTAGIKSTFSKSQRDKMLNTAMSTNVGNLIGDLFERALIATGAEIGPTGKGERRPIDLAKLGPVAELFGLDPNQPTEVKRSMKKLNLGKKGLSGQISRFLKLQGFSKGGSAKDTVPALLTPGEFVINKKAASRIGSSRLHQLNRADKIQGFNKGGVVQRFQNGGTPSGIGGNLSQKAVQQSADMEAAIQKIMMNLEKAAKSAQDAAYKQARSQGKTATEALDIGRQQATAVVNRLAPSGTLGNMAASRVVSNMAPNSGNLAGSNAAISQAGQQFAISLQSATTPLQKLTQAATQAGTGLLKVGKSALSAGIQKVGGGVLGMLGLGGLSTAGQQPGARFAAGRQAVAARRAGGMGGGMGGMGGGMGGMAMTMVGGLAVDQVSKALGGENTEAGRNVSAVGSSTLNMAATGAMIGSIIPGFGTALGGAIGAVAGFTMGIFEAQKANEEYAQNQRKAATEQAMEKSGAAISKFAQTGSKADRAAAIGSFTEAAATEQALGAGIKRGKGEDLGDFVKKKAQTQLAGAEQAEQFLSASMMQSGKTFDELSKTMKPEEFRTLVENIAEADERYVRLQELRNQALERGDTATADQLDAEQKQLAVELAKRKTAEVSAAAAAAKAANAAKSMSIAMQTAALNLERAFDAVGQSLNKISFDIEDASANIDQMISGQASLVSNMGQRSANILANPDAYSAQERQAAMGRGAQIMGSAGGQAMRLAELGPRLRNEATRVAVGQQAGGATNEEVGNTIKDTLRRQIEDTFGVGSPMAETAIKHMQSKIDESVKEFGPNTIGTLDVQSVIADAMSPITKVSEQAAKTIQQANEIVSQNLKALGETAQKVAELEQKRIGRTSALAGMRAQTGDSVAEALGIQLSSAQKAQTRLTERATRVGVSPAAYGAGALTQRRQQLIQQQEFLTNAARQAEAAAPTNPQAARDLVQFQSQLAVVNNTLKDLDSQLEELPQVLQEQIGDVIGEMQARVAQLQAQREAGAGLAEKIVTSTPQELQGMASTYNLLTNTLKGNITTIRDSQVAQKAYFESIRQGKTAQEAMNDAQSAFAEENKKALSMFNEMAQVAGIQGPEMDRMRADLISNFAKATGQSNNPFIQKIVSELRKDPAQRAANDPQLIAQQEMLKKLQDEQAEVTRRLNEENAKKQGEILTTGLGPLITAFTTAAGQITTSVDRLAAATGTRFASGGMVYASKGRLINFQPKGTDTVPAMLTPGEFVVNRKATQKNLGLLRSINNGQSTSGNYAVGGVVNTGTPTLDQNTINRAVSNSINNFQNTLGNVDKNTSHTRKVIDKEVSASKSFSRGGVVYASNGQLIGAQPKGTDTVPAMLTPGEFVVNKKATQKNMGLLKAINGGAKGYGRGGVIYAQDGVRVPYDFGQQTKPTEAPLFPIGINKQRGMASAEIGAPGSRIPEGDRLRALQQQQEYQDIEYEDLFGNKKTRKESDVERWTRLNDIRPPSIDSPDFAGRFLAFMEFMNDIGEGLGAGGGRGFKGAKTPPLLPSERQAMTPKTGRLDPSSSMDFSTNFIRHRDILRAAKIEKNRQFDEQYSTNRAQVQRFRETGALSQIKPPANAPQISFNELMTMAAGLTENDLQSLQFLGRGGSSSVFAINDYLALAADPLASRSSVLEYIRLANNKLVFKKSPNVTELEAYHGSDIGDLIDANHNQMIGRIKPRIFGQTLPIPEAGSLPDFIRFAAHYDAAVFEKLFQDQLRLAKEGYLEGLFDAKPENMVFGPGYIRQIDIGRKGDIGPSYFPTARPFVESGANDPLSASKVITSDKWRKEMKDRLLLVMESQIKRGLKSTDISISDVIKELGLETPPDLIGTGRGNQGKFTQALTPEKMGEIIVSSLMRSLGTNIDQGYNNFISTIGTVGPTLDEYGKSVKRLETIEQPVNKKYGGVVYASKGQQINFQPKGTDTVPAMLTPGEFVVNARATKQNLGLLHSINNGSKGYSKGGIVYLQGGGVTPNPEQGGDLFNEVGSMMGQYYTDAINTAKQQQKWFVTTSKDINTLRDQNGDPLFYGPAQAIESEGNIATVKGAPDSKVAIKTAKDIYNWFDATVDRVYPAFEWYTQQFKRLIQFTKNNKAALYKEAFDREIGKFPRLFEKPNADTSVKIPGNKDAFSEDGVMPDPKGKFMTKYITNPEKAQKILQDLSDRYYLLDLIRRNNEQAKSEFMAQAMNFPQYIPYAATAEDQITRAMAEKKHIQNLRLSTALKDYPLPSPSYQDSRLFNVTDAAIDGTYNTITRSRQYNRGGVVYASKGRMINFESKGSDTVPAMLTPGEFVVNRKAAQQNAGLLHAFNSGNYSSGGPVYLADGTPISYEERQKQRREAYEQQKAMRATAYQARTGRLMTGAGPAPAPAQQRQQPAQANGFEIKISKEAQDFLTTLTSKIDSFGKYIENLAAINIPDKIELNITAQPIEVRITGSAALENMSEGIRNMVTSEVNAKMSEIWSQSGGELGSRPA